MSNSPSTVEPERKGSIIMLFCIAGLVSAAATILLLRSLPYLVLPVSDLLSDDHLPLESFVLSLIGPGMPFAVLMLLAGAIAVQRGFVKLSDSPELWQLVAAACVMAFSYHAGVDTFGYTLLLSWALPESLVAVTVPIGFFVAGAAIVLFAAGAIRLVIDAFPQRVWVSMLAVGVSVMAVGVASTGMDVEKLDVLHLKSMLLIEPVLGGLIGYWLLSV